MWGLLRAVDEREPHPGRWAMAMWGAMGTGLLLKGLIAAVFPVGAGLLYLGLTGRLWVARDVGAVAAGAGNRAAAGDRGAVARAGDAAKSAVPGFHDAQRAGQLPRVLLVLLFQRAHSAISEPAISAGL